MNILGWGSIASGVVLLGLEIGMLAWTIPPFGNPITSVLMIVAFFYAGHKELKGKGLSKGERASMLILFLLFLVFLFIPLE